MSADDLREIRGFAELERAHVSEDDMHMLLTQQQHQSQGNMRTSMLGGAQRKNGERVQPRRPSATRAIFHILEARRVASADADEFLRSHAAPTAADLIDEGSEALLREAIARTMAKLRRLEYLRALLSMCSAHARERGLIIEDQYPLVVIAQDHHSAASTKKESERSLARASTIGAYIERTIEAGNEAQVREDLIAERLRFAGLVERVCDKYCAQCEAQINSCATIA